MIAPPDILRRIRIEPPAPDSTDRLLEVEAGVTAVVAGAARGR